MNSKNDTESGRYGMVKFYPVSSGSNGNCIFVGTDNTKILIDAGLSGKTIENGLKLEGISPDAIDAIFITHEHSDHVHGAGVLSRRYGLPVYATEKTWSFFNRHDTLGKMDEKNKRTVTGAVTIKDMEISAFPIPHDAIQPVGYSVRTGGMKLCVATDIGHPTDEIKAGICDADVLLLESNHDIEMLTNGRYPKMLKERIAGARGHLSNVQAGVLLTEIMTSRLKHIFLGHLSEDNNRPLIAFDTVAGILTASDIKIGIDVALHIAGRDGPGEAVVLN